MGLLVRSLPKKVTLFLCPISHTQNSHKMVDNVETTTPTVEEVATNGESEKTATEEVTAAATENGTNGVHKETTEEKDGEATEATNGAEAAKETTEETKEVVDEATKRKADEPSEDEIVEKIAKLKETAAEVVAEAEQKLPEEPLTEAEATA